MSNMKSETINYFAYGSNMNPERMKKRGMNFSECQQAILENHTLKFNKVSNADPRAGYANITPARDSFVQGIIYEIPREDIDKLDYYEGYPLHYTRSQVELVACASLCPVEAITYIANNNKTKAGLKPQKKYLDHLLKAESMLSPEYFDYLCSFETLEESSYHKIFVYGTLKSGKGNHSLLPAIGLKYVGISLVNFTSYHPGLPDISERHHLSKSRL